MFDCANVEIRELLPDLVAGTVDGVTRGRVVEHVASCAECASELETLRLVRSAFGAAPAIDVHRVVAALPTPPARRPAAPRGVPVKRWIDWRVAAALTTITVGGLSLAIGNRSSTGVDRSRPDSSIAAGPVNPGFTPVTAAPSASEPASSRDSGGSRDRHGESHAARPALTSGPRAKAQLSFGGGMSDLDDASIQQLLGALDEIDRAPVAPSADPDRSPVLPVIKGSDQ